MFCGLPVNLFFDLSRGVQGAKSIADVLKCNCKITDLYMNGNIIRAEGARAIAGVLLTGIASIL